MPGIAGLITKLPREQAVLQLYKMVAAIRHEPSYDTGASIDESLGVYVGWAFRRSPFSHQMPLHNERGDVALVFSGEEYPEPGIVQRLRDRGHCVDSDGRSYSVHLAEEDETFPSALNGMFHGLLADRRRGTVTLFTDRYGMHRLHWHQSKDAFYFGVEAKAILTVRPELRTPDPQSVGEFAACSCVLENRTLFRGIQVVPGGSAWTFRNGCIEQRSSYFTPREWEEQEPLNWESYYSEVRTAFARNLPRYFEGPEQVGMSLTGGLDTRLIMAWHQALPGHLPCYTFGGPFRECQDVLVARRIAKLCQQKHEVISVGQEFLSRFSDYAARSIYIAEGGVDVYRASDLYVSERARGIAPVKIVGTYGSEIVRQAVMFKPMKSTPGLFDKEFLSYVRQAGETYTRLRGEHPVTFAAFRQSPWYHYGILALEQTQLAVRAPYLDNEFVRSVYRAPKLNGTEEDLRLRMIGDGSPELGKLRTDRGIGGRSGLASAIAQGYQEFTFKAEYAYDYGMPQWVSRLDHFFSPLHFERLFLGRHKLLHFRMWYKNQLAAYVREMLLDPQTLSRPYLQRKGVEEIVQGHIQGGLNYTTAIHKLLTLELLQRQFFSPQ